MNNLRVARAVYALLLTFGYWNWMRIYPKLPQRIAVHFGYDGTPNGWASKDVLLWTTLIVVVILSVTTLGIPRLVTAVAGDRMNLPHRAYWLASERRKQTMGFIEAQSIWFGCAVLLLLYTAFQLAMNANLSPDHHFDSHIMWTALGVFFLVVVVWMIHFIWHFYRAGKVAQSLLELFRQTSDEQYESPGRVLRHLPGYQRYRTVAASFWLGNSVRSRWDWRRSVREWVAFVVFCTMLGLQQLD